MEVELPALEKIGSAFLLSNEMITKLNLPELKKAGNYFLLSARKLTDLNMPNLPKIRKKIMKRSKRLKKIDSKKLSQLDKNSNLTTSELSLAKKILERVKKLFQKRNDNEK